MLPLDVVRHLVCEAADRSDDGRLDRGVIQAGRSTASRCSSLAIARPGQESPAEGRAGSA
jgi:hypothetical protein